MKNNIKNVVFFALLLSSGLAGCKKQLDINENPNQPTASIITPELILPNALHGVGVQTANGYGWLANWMGYWSASGSFNPSTEESSYNITNTFQEVKWAGIYNVLFDLHQVEEKSRANNQPFFRGAAMIMKAHLFQNLVDIYGNVPYSQAFRPTEFPTPAYDKAQDIYANLQLKLDTAITLLKAAPVTSLIKSADIVNGGNNTLWIKLANTIKLRLLVRQSEITPNPTAELAKIKANGGVIQSGESADVNPGYQNDVGKQSPFYGAYGLLPSGTEANTFYRANAYSVTLLKQSNDPRLGYFFKPAKSPTNANNPFVGTVYGSEPNTAFGGDQTSNIGEGLVRSFNQAQWIVTSVESMFLQAEAVARGWDIGGPYAGNVKGAYEGAVTESFLWLGAKYPPIRNVANTLDSVVFTPAQSAVMFLQHPSATWDNAGATQTERVNFIVRQKYIALIGINPLEAWNDYRRLGVPSDVPLSVNTARGSRTIPVRLYYPSQELAVNAASVAAQGSVTTQSKLFWDK
ncbi:MAG: SusD/RagB family nutrient-binding outer rane lipoprotein [Segetibacter sp.]|nr:SusD/RagB family nutrient-binding outer rane lipoprotein [Segetibacter sp.]